MQFFLGQGADGATAGVVLFQQVDTPHGPLEVGLTFGPNGAVAHAMVTTATVETKPWVQEAVASGLMDEFVGMHEGDDPRKALQSVAGKLGGMPEYMAELVATAEWIGLRSHPHPEASISFGGPELPSWVDGALRGIVNNSTTRSGV